MTSLRAAVVCCGVAIQKTLTSWIASSQKTLLAMTATILLFLTINPTIFAQAIDMTAYHFDTPDQQQQFESMTSQLRCLVCQNESLWDSTAPLAKDLRTEIYQKVKQGESEADIKRYLVNRYGQFILFKPMFNHTTYVLWVLPFVLLLLAFLIVGGVVLRSKRLRS